VEIVAERFDIPMLIQKTIEKFTPPAEKKGLILTARISPDVGTIVSDRRRIEQISSTCSATRSSSPSEAKCASRRDEFGERRNVSAIGLGMKKRESPNSKLKTQVSSTEISWKFPWRIRASA